MDAGDTVVVTGGAGYIGCVLAAELLDRGYRVRVVDKLLFGDAGLTPVRDRIELVQADITAAEPSMFEGAAGVVHLAALSNDPMAEFQPRANHQINAVGTETVARAARAAGVARFVQASSCSVYDHGPQAEDRLLDESSLVKPRAAYAVSKYEAERRLLEMVGADFCPVILRKGTVFGFAPRMRYDLVVNTFVKDALSRGRLTVFHGGELWRPLVSVRDVARAHIAALEADSELVRGEVFNLVQRNYRILELAHRVRDALADDIQVAIDVRYEQTPARTYRVSGRKLERVLGFAPQESVSDAVVELLGRIRAGGYDDFGNPRYYNITWLRTLLEVEEMVARTGSVL